MFSWVGLSATRKPQRESLKRSEERSASENQHLFFSTPFNILAPVFSPEMVDKISLIRTPCPFPDIPTESITPYGDFPFGKQPTTLVSPIPLSILALSFSFLVPQGKDTSIRSTCSLFPFGFTRETYLPILVQ